jgi:Myb-like DNA-binding domain
MVCAFILFLSFLILVDRLEIIEEDEDDEIYNDEPGDRNEERVYFVTERELEDLLDDYNNFRCKETADKKRMKVSSKFNPPNARFLPLDKYRLHMTPDVSPFDSLSIKQMDLLNTQMQKHFQMLVQLTALSHEISNAELVSKGSIEMLKVLQQERDAALQSVGAFSILNITEVPIDKMAFVPSGADDIPSQPSIQPISLFNLPRHLDKFSLFDIEGLDKITVFNRLENYLNIALGASSTGEVSKLPIPANPNIRPDVTFTSPSNFFLYMQSANNITQSPADDEYTAIVPFKFKYMAHRRPEDPPLTYKDYVLPKSISNILLIFKNSFAESVKILLSNECHQSRMKFTESEDRLLMRGLRKFGNSNLQWGKIRRNYLPAKSDQQIKVRYKNMIARTAPPNPIKVPFS